jgi:O-antigen/teichoic acid export membrane protein
MSANQNMIRNIIYIIVIGTIFQSFNVIKFYFQAKVLSKYTVYAQVFSTILCAVIKLLLIYFNMGLIYFAMVTLFQSIILTSGLIVMYVKQKSSLFKWSVNFGLAKRLLKDSWPLILSGIAISMYMRIDQVMIKNMLDAEAVGNYAIAVRLSEVWYFIPVLITSSVFPAIINAKNISEKLYYKRIQNLYSLMIWLSIGIAIPITFLANDIIRFLFGAQYQNAVSVLKIHIWAGVFVFFGCAWSKWILNENKQMLITLSHILGAALNILFNYKLIPICGIVGAAIATILSYFLSELLGILLYKPYTTFILVRNIVLLRKYK